MRARRSCCAAQTRLSGALARFHSLTGSGIGASRWATVDMARAEREIAAALQKLQPAGKASGPHTACQPSSAAGAGSGGLGLRGTNLLHTALVVSLGLAVTGPFWAQPLIR